MPSPQIALVAGEASGDWLGAQLIRSLRQRIPSAHFYGVGGPRMLEAGFEAWSPAERLAVRGYAEVLKHYIPLIRLRKTLGERLLGKERPDLFIGIDAPDFNLSLEQNLRQGGVPVAHYVSPSLWAWRGERIRQMKSATDHVLCLFPFETEIYKAVGISATFVGHPLSDILPQEPNQALARQTLNIPPNVPVVALLPGSRQSELHYLGDCFASTARLIQKALPKVHFVTPLTSPETETLWQEAADRHGLSFQAVPRNATLALTASDIALVASGTATLETALLQRPMVIAYRMSPLSWKWMRNKRYLPWVGLPNILCREYVVPEFLQEQASPRNMSQALLNMLADEGFTQPIRERFIKLRKYLQHPNTHPQSTIHSASDCAAQALQTHFFRQY